MASILQHRVTWTGSLMGSGITVMNAKPKDPADLIGAAFDLALAIARFWEALKPYLPTNVTLTFPQEITVHDEVTGDLLDAIPVAPAAQVVGTASQTTPAGAGARLDWATGRVVASRRLRGRTYVVPFSGSTGNWTAQGGVAPGAQTAVEDAAKKHLLGLGLDPFVNDFDLVVWSRTHGVAHKVSSVDVTNVPATLTSRKR